MKKLLSLILSIMMITGTMAIISTSTASALVTEENFTLYFELPSNWTNTKKVYCHLWKDGSSTSMYGWQTRNTECEKVDDNLYKYVIEGVRYEKLQKYGGVNMVIFSNNAGKQTYDLTFGSACNGDTVYTKGEEIENPIDSHKTCFMAYWKTHTEYGPKYQVNTSGAAFGTTKDPEKVEVPSDDKKDDNKTEDKKTDEKNDDKKTDNTTSNTAENNKTENTTNTQTSNTISDNDIKSTAPTGDTTATAAIIFVLACAAAAIVLTKKKAIE